MSASNAMFQNLANNTLTPVVPTSFNMKLLIGLGILLAILIGYAIYHYYTKQNMPFLPDRISTYSIMDTIGKFGLDVGTNLNKELAQEHKEAESMVKNDERIVKQNLGEPQIEKPTADRETWCFVGEDLTGRFCVKVPSPQSCSHDRTFGSRSDCEMTPASHMPAGIVTDNGLLPLSAKKV
jgi:hypothetical protein